MAWTSPHSLVHWFQVFSYALFSARLRSQITATSRLRTMFLLHQNYKSFAVNAHQYFAQVSWTRIFTWKLHSLPSQRWGHQRFCYRWSSIQFCSTALIDAIEWMHLGYLQISATLPYLKIVSSSQNIHIGSSTKCKTKSWMNIFVYSHR